MDDIKMNVEQGLEVLNVKTKFIREMCRDVVT
jgi:hypothetical protein